MYRLTAVYDHPADPQQFLEHYSGVHSVLASRMPGLVAFNWGVCETPDGSKPPYFLIATLDWASKKDAFAALSSAEGQEATADLVNFTEPDGYRMTFAEVTQAV